MDSIVSRKDIANKLRLLKEVKKQSITVYLLTNYRERQAHKGTRQVLSVHFIGYSFEVILLPCVLLNL